MKMWEIKQLPREEVEQQLEDALEEFQNLRFQHATKQLDDTSKLSVIRKDIARFKTVLKEMELGLRPEKANEA